MVSDNFTNTFADELKALVSSDDLNQFCSAAALFHWDDSVNIGTRIEATQIMVEFSDNVEFGRDPEGLLFYNSPGDLAQDGPSTYYRVHLNTESPKAIRIDFFWHDPNDSQYQGLNPFAKFLTKDTSSIPSIIMNRLDKHNGKGDWRKLDMGVCSTVLDKKHNDTIVTLTVNSIRKKVTFKVTDALAKLHIDKAPGVLHFHSVDDIVDKKTCIANFDSDRVLFYNNLNEDKKKLVGTYLPSSGPLPTEFNDQGDRNPPVATWSST